MNSLSHLTCLLDLRLRTCMILNFFLGGGRIEFICGFWIDVKWMSRVFEIWVYVIGTNALVHVLGSRCVCIIDSLAMDTSSFGMLGTLVRMSLGKFFCILKCALSFLERRKPTSNDISAFIFWARFFCFVAW